MPEGHCMKCKCKQTMVSTENVKTKKGVPAMKGKCKKCGTNMFVMLGKKSGGNKSKSKKSKSKKSKSKK